MSAGQPRRKKKQRQRQTSTTKNEGVNLASLFRARKGKVSGGIIALSSAAIVSVYAMGRANSSSISNQLAFTAPTAVIQAPSAVPTGAVPTVGAPATGIAPTPTQAAIVYKDGTYTGSGNSRHGGMDVTVVIQNGRITSANVVSCSTRYSCSDVDPLVSETVSSQGVPIDYVSGATDSSDAYAQAVDNALAQARA